jgi:alpha-1,3-mannosyltransferase
MSGVSYLLPCLAKTIHWLCIHPVYFTKVWLALPFLIQFPREYLSKAFEFKRVFQYQWTVNWRMISQSSFLSPGFASLLTALHLSTLAWFAWTKWSRAFGEDGLIPLVVRGLRNWRRPAAKRPNDLTADCKWSSPQPISAQKHQFLLSLIFLDMVKVCFTCNLIGIICARTLHYQFYSWYAHQIVFLAWQTPYPIFLR